jgi:hypothetical protein
VWSFASIAVRHVLLLVVLVLRRSEFQQIEILVLRHDLEMPRRQQPRPRPAGLACCAEPAPTRANSYPITWTTSSACCTSQMGHHYRR